MTKQKRTVLSIKDRIRTMKLKDIKPYGNNPRKNDAAVDALIRSIDEFEYEQPLIVDRDGVIIVGHTRYKALKKMGVDECDVIVADNLTEEQAKAYRIADNSTGEIAMWDYDLLVSEIQGLDYDMSEFGLDLTDTEAGDDDLDPNDIVEDDYEPPEELAPVVKLGEIWRCGDHVLLCGDATKEEDVRRLVKEGGGK